jgi:hypothetical protein
VRLQVYDSDGGISGGNKLADTLSKAFFGDGEAAAKIALAKAQIAAQQAHAGYYGAQTSKTAQDTRIEGERHGVNVRAGDAAAREAELSVQRPQPLPVPVPSGTEAIRIEGPVSSAGERISTAPSTNITAPPPVPVQVTPVTAEQQALYEAKRRAEAERARAVYIAGGNAQQVAQGGNLQSGGVLVRNATDPDQVRRGAILTTGNLPTKDTVTVAGDTAGINAGLAADIAKENAKPILRTDPVTGLTTQIVRDPTAPGGFLEIPVPGTVPGKKVDPTTTQETDTRIEAISRKMAEGLPISMDEARVYARDVQRTHQPQDIESQDPATKQMVKRFDYVLPPGVPHPRDVLAAASAGPVAAPTTAPPGQVQPPAAPQTTPVLGETRVSKVAPSATPTTEMGIRARGFTERVAEALPFFGDSVKDGPFTARNVPNDLVSVVASLPTGSATADVFLAQIPNGPTKQYITAALNIIYPILRLESGALISKQEIMNMLMTHVPMPNEDQSTVEQKLGAMAAAVRGIAVMGFGNMDTPEYKQFRTGLAARGFNLDRTFTGQGVNNVFTPGGVVTQPRATVPGGAVGAPAVGAPPEEKPVRKLDLKTGKFL